MSISRREMLRNSALGLPLLGLKPSSVFESPATDDLTIQSGPFSPTRASLRKYEIPDWFRDAKFGIWAHWGPQSAIEAGDWYARNMYMQGSHQNKYHVEHYGHPSKFGYKDTIPAWKAERFDADYLLGLYKKAGAKYFMSMGVHHDNFDLWNSKHNGWNSVKMGPKKDIVGMFGKAAQKHGLKFGISDHLWISYKWFSTSKGSDKTGDLAGVKYDGADPKNFSLYGSCEEVFNKLDWTENGIPVAWKKHWFDRMKDLIDNYEPDLLYCDGHMPFEEYGLSILAHLYNKSAAKHNGKTQAVYTSKRPEDSDKGNGICVFDVERGVVETIWPLAWQTDTCIGDWHYNRERIGKYKTAKTVIDLLVDIVSRNGNLMLNMPLPASGMLDNDELKVLDGITQWMAVNSEGIYATRPWKIFGTGPRTAIVTNEKEVNSSQQFNESKRKEFTYEDVRFTTKGDTLYAFFMGWPGDGKLDIRALGTNSEQKTGEITSVELLGGGKLTFARDGEALKVVMPDHKPSEYACTLKIRGTNLV
jgi:alpha-L-fucosidase